MNRENALKLRESYKKQSVEELVQTIRNQDGLVALHNRMYQRSGNYSGHGAIEFMHEMLKALEEKVLVGEAEPDVFNKLDRYQMYVAVKKELEDRQKQIEEQRQLENQSRIENMDDLELLSSIREYRVENEINPQFLKTCEFELAKRIIEGKITNAPDGFEDIFEVFQLAVELELAKQKQLVVENQKGTEDK